MEPVISAATMLTDAPGRRRAGALAFIAGALLYVTVEGVVAAAWNTPPYNYVSNYISDLGVVDPQVYQGRDVNSPLGWLMNTNFVLSGLLFAIGAALLAILFTGIWRRLFVASAALYFVGNVFVGVFNEAADTGPMHVIGALLAIGFGNLTALVAGLALLAGRGASKVGTASAGAGVPRAGLPRWFAVACIVLPVLGALSEVVLLAGLSDPALDGLWERGGVYSVTAFQLLIGVVVLSTLRAEQAAVERVYSS